MILRLRVVFGGKTVFGRFSLLACQFFFKNSTSSTKPLVDQRHCVMAFGIIFFSLPNAWGHGDFFFGGREGRGCIRTSSAITGFRKYSNRTCFSCFRPPRQFYHHKQYSVCRINMAGIYALQMVRSSPKFNGQNYKVGRRRVIQTVVSTAWP